MRSAILRALAMSWVIESVGDAEILHRGDDQIVDDVGHDRIEAGGRLVEEDDLRIGGDGARQADALLHAAGKFGRRKIARRRRRGRPWRVSRSRCRLRLAARHAAALDQTEGDILPDRQAVEQRRALEQHAEFAQHTRRARGRARWVTSSPSTKIWPASGRRMPSTHLIVTDLPVPEPPMTTSDSPGSIVEIDAVEHDLRPEAFLDAAQFDLWELPSPCSLRENRWR